MKHGLVVAIACGVAVVAVSRRASARGDSPPRDGICAYEHPDFRGDYFCAKIGDGLSFIPSGLNDRISSIRVFGNAEVTVFSDRRFEGSSERFDDDVRDLKYEDWDDRISSLRVERSSHGGRHEHSDRRGYSGDPDRIVRRAYQDILGRDPDAAGLRLYRSRMIDDDWSEQQVRDALRDSPEYRKVARKRAEDVVQRAYLSVFKRAPDAGSRAYVDRVLREEWTQQDVERALRDSPEFKQKSAMTRAKAEEIVRRAYLAVFEREPDAGSRGYVDRVLRDGWTQQDVERELRKSPEYRKKR